MTQQIIRNILVGSIALAASVTTNAQTKSKKVMLDNYFNNEYRKNKKGELEKFHYLWSDTAESGYSKWGAIFQQHGCSLATLTTAPTAENLAGTGVYIIADPDTPTETANPNYISNQDIAVIVKWVKQGGRLIIMANDSLNTEFAHLNQLTEKFGIHLNGDKKSKVVNDNYEMAAFFIPATDSVFQTARKVYLKEVSSLSLMNTAKPILNHHKDGYTVAACSYYGKGKVLVVGDPWFYNEYLNGRLGDKWDNDKAAADIVKWILK